MSNDYIEINDISPQKYIKKKKKYDRKNTPSIMREILSYVITIAIACGIAFFLLTFVIFNAIVPSGSMISTIEKGDRLIGFRLSYVFSQPARGDIVIFKFPDDETQNYVKRIIGLPGETVHIYNGHVYVNNELLEENYLNEPMNPNEDLTFEVPENHYFMMGDNRNASKDSRYWNNHFVSRDKIEAKAGLKYYSGSKNFIDFDLLK